MLGVQIQHDLTVNLEIFRIIKVSYRLPHLWFRLHVRVPEEVGGRRAMDESGGDLKQI